MSAEHSPANRAGAPALKRGDRVRRKSTGEVVVIESVALGFITYAGGALDAPVTWFELVEELAPEPAEWTPGDGWREVDESWFNPGRTRVLTDVQYVDGDWQSRHWIPVEPVPPLPTEPGYYLSTEEHLVVEKLGSAGGEWVDAGDRNYLDEDAVRALGPLQRLELRAVIAKAVLDRIASEPWARETDLAKWRTEFGVEA